MLRHINYKICVGVYLMELEQNKILTTIQQAINKYQPNEWMSLKDGASYAGVSYNTRNDTSFQCI